MKVTPENIIDLLPIVAHHEWLVHPRTGDIRNENGFCPLCALAVELGEIPYHRNDAWLTPTTYDMWRGSHIEDARREIVAAADDVNVVRPDIRLKMRLVLGAK